MNNIKTFLGVQLEEPITEREYNKQYMRNKNHTKSPCPCCEKPILYSIKSRHLKTKKCQKARYIKHNELCVQLMNNNDMLFTNNNDIFRFTKDDLEKALKKCDFHVGRAYNYLTLPQEPIEEEIEEDPMGPFETIYRAILARNNINI